MSKVTQMTQMTQGGLGNTKTKPDTKVSKPCNTRSRKWCFTENNYEEKRVTQLHKLFKNEKCQYIVGKEVGENGTPHLQGYVEYKNPRSFSSMKKLLSTRVHLEKARGNTRQNYDYCSKDGDFITNMDFRTFRQKLKDKVLEKEYKDVVWKDWQQEILDIKQDNRKIYWYWDKDGNIGKSYLVKYMAITRDVIICDGKKNDIYNQVNTMLDNEKEPTIILCDIPRTSIDYINYGVLEKLKDGCIYSGKYEGGMCVFTNPIVICLANQPPDESTMSKDRWVIKEIKKNE